MKGKIILQTAHFFEKIVKLRRQIHANPELSFLEVETAKLVAKTLLDCGLEVQEGVAKTGVVGILKGEIASEKCIALRADMDALPILEENKISFCSKNTGVMHACGHDAHTATLLGVAMVLSSLKKEIRGAIKFIFQPSEEKLPSGAEAMIAAGVLKNPTPSCILGWHVHPELEVGNVGFCSGNFMASADEIYLTVTGKGGHAAQPKNFISPLIIAAEILLALNEINDLEKPLVLSFGKIEAAGATNVIPEKAYLAGTLRCFDEKERADVHLKIKEVCEQISQKHKGHCEVNVVKGSPVLKNDFSLTEHCKRSASKLFEKPQIHDLPIRMGAEDFAFYSQEIPACFYRVGVGNKSAGIQSPIHSSTFNIDENALRVAVELMSFLTIEILNNEDVVKI